MKRGLIETILALAVFALLAWAMLTQAQATKRTAAVAQVAATGQTVSSLGLVLLVGVLLGVLLVGGAVVVFLWLWLQRARGRGHERRRGSVGEGMRAQRWLQEAGRAGGTGGVLDALIQVELLRMLRESRSPRAPWPRSMEERTGAGEEADDDDAWDTWYL